MISETFIYELYRVDFMYALYLNSFLHKPFDYSMVLGKYLCFIFSIALKRNYSQDTNSLAIFWSSEFVHHLLQYIAEVAMYLALGQGVP